MLMPFMYETANGEEHSNQRSVCCLRLVISEYEQFSVLKNHTVSS